MIIALSWLYELVPGLEAACVSEREFCEVMTKAGTKVERFEKTGANISGIYIGRIISVEKHPNADKLVITKVDAGEGELQIVTGADNVFPGAYVPVAVDGAVLADGKIIRKGELRGVESNGMLCSIEELGETRANFPEAPEHGIYIFEGEPEVGADAADALRLRDCIIEFELTSNRADCFSAEGIAREAAAAFGLPFGGVTAEAAGEGAAGDYVSVEIKNGALCPRYSARVINNVNIAPSPLWMRRKLSKSGLRPINNIVDITNYVMLELGQPMHAFDIETIAIEPAIDDNDDNAGGRRKIIVRNAVPGEAFVTLDGASRVLGGGALVIADREKAVAVAGIMGGENSKVTGGAGAVLFESANFNGASIRKTSKALGLRTDSSARYEKNIDPELTMRAVNRACDLVKTLGCGDVAGGAADAYPAPVRAVSVKYRPLSVNKLLGANIGAEEMRRLLVPLGINAAPIGGEEDVWEASIPSYRPDITIEADIAEEVARLYGYDSIETTLVKGATTIGGLSKPQTLKELLREASIAAGFSEALTLAFESPKVFDKLNFGAGHYMREAVRISNPLGEDYSIMRTQTVNAALTSLANNCRKHNEEAALFEIAKRYSPKPGGKTPLTEIETLTLAAYGDWDFYTFKGAAEAVLSRVGIKRLSYAVNRAVSCMHPGRSAVVSAGGGNGLLGFLGEVHPLVLKKYEIDATAYICSFDISAIAAAAELGAKYKPLPKTQAVKRDIAVVVPDSVTHSQIEASVIGHGGAFLEGVKLFDVYRGEGIEDGNRSAAYSLVLRNPEKTLTDEEINKTVDAIVKGLREDVGAKLR